MRASTTYLCRPLSDRSSRMLCERLNRSRVSRCETSVSFQLGIKYPIIVYDFMCVIINRINYLTLSDICSNA